MGTSKSGRYLNTEGSGRSVSDFALVHSSEGAFTRSQTRVNGEMVIKLRLNNGGHSQKGMELLDKYGIRYNIVKTYPNGVRVGNIPNHMQKAKRKEMGQAWFPKRGRIKIFAVQENTLPDLKEIAVSQMARKYMVFTKVYVSVLYEPMVKLPRCFPIQTKINGGNIYAVC